MTVSNVTFKSAGEDLAGLLFLPDGPPRGTVVLSGALTSVKEQAASAYGRALSARGFAALAFDHRTFGASTGAPRQFENPQAKAEDIRAAAAAAAAWPETRGRPVAGVGICAGAGYMATAVSGHDGFQAFGGVGGVYTEAAQTRTWMGERYDPEMQRARRAEQRFRETGVSEEIPAVAADLGDVAMPLLEAYEFYGTPRGAVPTYVNAFAVQSRAYTLPYDALSAAPGIAVPAVMVHSEHALSPDLARRFFPALPAQKEEHWIQSKGQIDFYDDAAVIDPAADAVAAFLRRVLPPA